MCSPAAAVAGGGILLDAFGQQKSASANQRYENMLYAQRKEQALDDYAMLEERASQERAAAAADILRITRQSRQSADAARLTALESGTGGRSYQALLAQFEADRLAGVGVTEQNLDFQTRQIRAQQRAALRLTPPRRFEGPFDSPLGILSVGLGVAGGALG